MPNAQENTIIYVILPSLSPTSLARLIGRLLSTKLAHPSTIITKLIPLSAALTDHTLPQIAFELYDALPRHLHATKLRGMPTEPEVSLAQYHSFTLVQEGPVQPELTLAWPLRSYDPLNRWRVVHCAYIYDKATKRAVGFALDAEGEGWVSKTFTFGEADGAVVGLVNELWTFYTEWARLASVEYRLVISAVGRITKHEIDSKSRFCYQTTTTTIMGANSSLARINRQDQNTRFARHCRTAFFWRTNYSAATAPHRRSNDCHSPVHLRRPSHETDRRIPLCHVVRTPSNPLCAEYGLHHPPGFLWDIPLTNSIPLVTLFHSLPSCLPDRGIWTCRCRRK